VVVDASTWVASYIPEEARHAAAETWLVQNRDRDLTIPSLALAEVAGALARRSGQALALRALEDIRRWPGIGIVPVDEQLALEAARLASAHRLRGADAVYVAVAAHLGMSLVTLDAELAGRAGAAISVLRI
jgi:predicted nucleic acid-binding protein